jgi:hypothetical protein
MDCDDPMPIPVTGWLLANGADNAAFKSPDSFGHSDAAGTDEA